jgi:hypothetical protein
MEMHVFSDSRLNSTAEWQRAIDLQAHPLKFLPGAKLATAQGFFPATLAGKASGFECYHDDANKMIEHYGRSNFLKPWKYALGFRFRGDFTELQAAWIAAAAYARATNGIVFDGESGRSYTPPEAEGVISDIIRDLPAVEAALKKMETDALATRRK